VTRESQYDDHEVHAYMYTWCIHGVYMVYTWCKHGVYMVYTWCIHGVYMMYTWQQCVDGDKRKHGMLRVDQCDRGRWRKCCRINVRPVQAWKSDVKLTSSYMVYTWCILYVYCMYTWCVHGVYITHGVYCMYTWALVESIQ